MTKVRSLLVVLGLAAAAALQPAAAQASWLPSTIQLISRSPAHRGWCADLASMVNRFAVITQPCGAPVPDVRVRQWQAIDGTGPSRLKSMYDGNCADVEIDYISPVGTACDLPEVSLWRFDSYTGQISTTDDQGAQICWTVDATFGDVFINRPCAEDNRDQKWVLRTVAARVR